METVRPTPSVVRKTSRSNKRFRLPLAASIRFNAAPPRAAARLARHDETADPDHEGYELLRTAANSRYPQSIKTPARELSKTEHGPRTGTELCDRINAQGMIPKSCRLSGQDHAAEQMLRA